MAAASEAGSNAATAAQPGVTTPKNGPGELPNPKPNLTLKA